MIWRQQQSVRNLVWTVMTCTLACGVLTAASGCSEHRITLQEYLDRESELMAAPVVDIPTTQPTSGPEAIEMVDQELRPYEVGVDDLLLVTLSGLDQILLAPIQVRVAEDGTILLPTVGRVKVGGLRLLDVERAIYDAYVPRVYKDIAVNVTMVQPENTEVMVVGAATMPGLVQLSRRERNPLFAVIRAGGVTELASGKVTIKRLRKPEEPITLDIFEPEGVTAALALPPLQNGDIVHVHAATPNTIFVGGLVNAPQAQVYPPGTRVTILQAIAASAGLRTDVTPTEATLIRRTPSGEDVHVKLDIRKIASGEHKNLELAAGDILWVPETIGTRIEDWINRNVFVRVGASATYNLNYNHSGLDFLNNAARRNSRAGLGGGSLQDSFDPFGFLLRNQALNRIVPAPAKPAN